MSIESARTALVKGESANDEVLRLQSELGLDRNTIVFGLIVDGFVDKALSEAVKDITVDSLPGSFQARFKEELWKSFGKRYGGWTDVDLRGLALNVSGVSLLDGAKRLGIAPQGLKELSARKGFLAERKWILGEIAALVGDFVAVDLKVETQLKPIVRRLGRKALEHLDGDELTAKECLKSFTELGKLLAQVTGELVEKKSVEIGPTEQFRAIMEAAKGIDPSTIIAGNYELLE